MKINKIKYVIEDRWTALNVGYIVNNNLRENTCECHENWRKFWVIIWRTFYLKFSTTFCLSCHDCCGRNHCQRLFCSRDLGWLTTGNSDIYVTVAADHVEFYQNQQVFMGWIKHLAGQILAHGPYVGHPLTVLCQVFQKQDKSFKADWHCLSEVQYCNSHCSA